MRKKNNVINLAVLNMRRKVAKYLRRPDVRIEPLRFENLMGEEYISKNNEFDPTQRSIADMIDRVLELKEENSSVNVVTGARETGYGRHRSVLDIWRHIRYYCPTISIFDVMGNMHLVDGIRGHYCPTVNRFVFSLGRLRSYMERPYGRTEFGFWYDKYKHM